MYMKSVFVGVIAVLGVIVLVVLMLAIGTAVWMIPVYLVGSYFDLPMNLMIGIAVGLSLITSAISSKSSS